MDEDSAEFRARVRWLAAKVEANTEQHRRAERARRDTAPVLGLQDRPDAPVTVGRGDWRGDAAEDATWD